MAKNSPSGHHHTRLLGYILATDARIDNRKKNLFKPQYLLHMSSQYGERRPTNGWNRFGSLEHPYEFQRVSRLGSVTARHYASAKLCDIEQRAPPIFGRAAITLGIGPHSSFNMEPRLKLRVRRALSCWKMKNLAWDPTYRWRAEIVITASRYDNRLQYSWFHDRQV